VANPNARDVKAVTKAVVEPAVAGVLLTLVGRGCDREELLRLLPAFRSRSGRQGSGSWFCSSSPASGLARQSP